MQRKLMLKSLLVTTVHAAFDLRHNINPGDAGCDFTGGNTRWDCIGNYAGLLAQVVIGFAGSIALVFLIINGIRYMLNSATGEDSSSAKTGVFHALLGVALAGLSYIIMETIVSNVA